MNKRIVAAKRKLDRAEKLFQNTLATIQLSCGHHHVAECSYNPSDYFSNSSSPPERVCLDCGIAEEGWGTYYILNQPDDRVYHISRDEFYKIRIGAWIQDEEKTLLLRKEKTRNQIIKENIMEREE